MRKFVEKISENGESWHPGFIVVPQNGLALLSSDGTPQGSPENAYIAAIDGVGQEELWYGYDNKDDIATPETEHSEMLSMCLFARDHGLKVMVTDYAISDANIDDSYSRNSDNNFISFAADHRELDNIPHNPLYPFHFYQAAQVTFPSAKNFLYLINPSYYATKEEYVHALEHTKYDLYVLDLFFNETERLDTADLNRIRRNNYGLDCKILCYMSIGEAESYRWYWKPYWNVTPPPFLVAEDPSWPDNFTVRYWDPNWQAIICGQGDSYLKRIVNAGFDGVYLDLVSNYEYFEE
ncbi:MAG: endo alpha-1,4 polygalactosaminidase [Bacteroidia bacterium]